MDGLLRRQTHATLGTTGVDHLATTARRHAGTKTVGAGTLEAAWLKCTFHDLNWFRIVNVDAGVPAPGPESSASTTDSIATAKGPEF